MTAPLAPGRAPRASSPRTNARPMAFTGAEFLRGVLAAWLWAMALPSLAWFVIFFPAGFIGAFFVIPIATACTVMFAPLAWLLGTALRGVSRRAVHAALFATFGALVGAVATVLYAMWTSGDLSMLDTPVFVGVNALCGAAAVALGWRHAMRRALGVVTTPRRAAVRSAEDAAAEDHLAERLRVS